MALVISQETFDNAVKENIEEFQMSSEEAVKNAIEEFKAQGVDLSNIVTSSSGDNDSERLKNMIDLIEKAIAENSFNSEDFLSNLNALNAECSKDIAHRVLAGKLNLYGHLVEITKKLNGDEPTAAVLSTLTALMTGQPDLLDENGISLIMSLMKMENVDLYQPTLIWVKQCIVKHERNRQGLMEADIAPLLVALLTNESTPASVIRETCRVSRALVLDDDIRVPYGKAHDHCRILAGDCNVLDILTSLLSRYKNDHATLLEVISTMAALAVRNEFCLAVHKAGGLQLVLDILVSFPENEKLARQSMKLLKSLAGNDDVKKYIADAGVLPVVTSTMIRHEASATVASAGCSLIAALTLRSPENSIKAHDAGVEEVIAQIMKMHAGNADVLRMASLAIRNMVSRSRDLSEHFIKHGVPELLMDAMKRHKATCESNAKGALRDLGCPVDLKEEWKGKSKTPLTKN
ncbi:armadillo repeat-containing protein 6 homolog [Ischnura elegans]|uniref:armadillo repeat-containing protein 6 homolog n=1 Tax=Ischnura elegans TaxID=197161 RepID=UPI001ED88AD2|nr:armadillo repeat-containing protein 6 homolog [Ischnura elegans]